MVETLGRSIVECPIDQWPLTTDLFRLRRLRCFQHFQGVRDCIIGSIRKTLCTFCSVETLYCVIKIKSTWDLLFFVLFPIYSHTPCFWSFLTSVNDDFLLIHSGTVNLPQRCALLRQTRTSNECFLCHWSRKHVIFCCNCRCGLSVKINDFAPSWPDVYKHFVRPCLRLSM